MPNRHNDEQHLAARDRAKRAGYLSGRWLFERHRNALIAAELGIGESAIRHYPSRYPREWRAAFDRGWAETQAEWEAQREAERQAEIAAYRARYTGRH